MHRRGTRIWLYTCDLWVRWLGWLAVELGFDVQPIYPPRCSPVLRSTSETTTACSTPCSRVRCNTWSHPDGTPSTHTSTTRTDTSSCSLRRSPRTTAPYGGYTLPNAGPVAFRRFSRPVIADLLAPQPIARRVFAVFCAVRVNP